MKDEQQHSQLIKKRSLLAISLVTVVLCWVVTDDHTRSHVLSIKQRLARGNPEEMERSLGVTRCAQYLERLEEVNSCFVDMPLVDDDSMVFIWDAKEGKATEKQARNDVMQSELPGFACTKSVKSFHPSGMLVLTYPDETVVTLHPDSCIIKGVYHVVRATTAKHKRIHPHVKKMVSETEPVELLTPDALSVIDDGMTWTHVWSAKTFKNVAISAHGTIYAIDVNDHIYTKRSAFSGAWEQIGGGLKEIAVENGGSIVAGVNLYDHIYYRDGVNPTNNLKGTSWRLMRGTLKDIALASSYAWGVNSIDDIYLAPIGTNAWVHVPGKLRQISAHGWHVVGTNSANAIFKRGNTWHQWSGAAVCASMGSDGAFWVIGADGRSIYKYGHSWLLIPGTLKQIDVANAANVVGVNRFGHVFVRTRLTSSNLARRFAPVLSFPSNTRGYPMDAGKYFKKLFIQGHPGVRYAHCTFYHITEQASFDPAKMVTYFKYGKCGTRTAINYRWFYGMQYPCISALGCKAKGWHGGDWENIVIVLNAAKTAVERVRFNQHDGRYERTRGNMEFHGGRVKVYVGWWAHGSYDTKIAPPLQGVQTCQYYGDLSPNHPARLWGTSGSKMLDLRTKAEWWMDRAKYDSTCQIGEKTRGLGFFCGVFGQLGGNTNENLCPGAACAGDGCYRDGKRCSNNDQCFQSNILGVLQRIKGHIGCCQNICQNKKRDWANVLYCPHECRGAWNKGAGTC